MYFNSVRSANSLSSSCLNRIESEKKLLFDQAQYKLRKKATADCLSSELKDNEEYKNLLLKLRTIKSINEGLSMNVIGSALTNRKSLKDNAIERVEKELDDVLSEYEVKCDLRDGFGNLFDSFFDNVNEDDEYVPYEDVQEYCIKKELSEQQVIDIERHSLQLNPKNLRVDNIDCDVIMNHLKSETIDSLKDLEYQYSDKNKKRCIHSKLREGDRYVHQLLKAELLRKLILTTSEKLEEKESFIKNMAAVAKEIHDHC